MPTYLIEKVSQGFATAALFCIPNPTARTLPANPCSWALKYLAMLV
jgi:hypothetical protein